MKRLHPVVALLVALVLNAAPVPALADGAWLDGPLQNWNSPGMVVPAAPPPDASDDPRCAASNRPIETPQDQQVAAAGWTLFGTYEGGWGVVVALGLVGHDGMCRPFTFQGFVFVDGTVAGTISPVPMSSRTDGTGYVNYFTADRLSATFARYADTDPLCCPSRTTSVEYAIQREGPAPILVPTAANTQQRTP